MFRASHREERLILAVIARAVRPRHPAGHVHLVTLRDRHAGCARSR